MNMLRNIFTLKVIAFVALSSLFMTSMTPNTAQAFGSSCPCQFFSSFRYEKRLIRPFGGKPELCFRESNGDVVIEGRNSGCRFRLRAFQPDPNVCRVELDCGNSFVGEGDLDFIDFDSETLEACKRELRIIKWFYHITDECTL